MLHQIHVYQLLIIYFQLNLMFLLQHDKLQQIVDILEQLFEFLIEPIERKKKKFFNILSEEFNRITSSACLQAS